ncbi:alanine racemase [Flavisphingomonas formosensis]|uniref:alanine racemase n=1 Tax=Flavisphingomonas formosensis TaxID=861534 RepID=UPI0012FBE672|nr:alanine racemase [Sphingomonas formosensis]
MARFACPSYSSQLRIDLGALRANYRALADHAAPALCGAVVKADAYGLGAAKVAAALAREGCRIFFVAQLGEAFDVLDAVGIDSSIYILNGLDPGGEAACAEWGFVPVLNGRGQLDRWRAFARAAGKPLRAALQMDSGMSRLGLDLAALADLAQDRSFGEEISLCLLMTHLACADEPDRAANDAQLAQFGAARALFPDVPASIANSGGTFLSPDFHCDVVRAGIALYGARPGPQAPPLRPVVSLDARVIQIREIGEGTGVGYGLDYVADTRRRLATIGVGYADGWPRSLGGNGAAWLDGQRLPIVGRVSMDSLTIDISDLPPTALGEGDFVELLGPHQSLDDVARDAGTISYEILTRLGRRHARVHVEDQAAEIVAAGARI